MTQTVKNLPAQQETQVPSLGREGPLEEGMATHPSVLAWRVPRTEEPVGYRPCGRRVRHDYRLTQTHEVVPCGGSPGSCFFASPSF